MCSTYTAPVRIECETETYRCTPKKLIFAQMVSATYESYQVWEKSRRLSQGKTENKLIGTGEREPSPEKHPRLPRCRHKERCFSTVHPRPSIIPKRTRSVA